MPQFNNLYIAEKPSLAEAIAQARAEQIGATASKVDGYWQVGDDAVTWLFGHMYELAEPGEYGEQWKRGGIDTLPIHVESDQWKLVPDEGKKPHIRKIRDLLRSARTVVNCGDAAREGQLLVDEVIIENGVDAFSPEVQRLWVKSMARKDMLAALDGVFPNKDKRPLYDSATSRQRADWLHGMNFSRLYSALARNSGQDVKISVGRVQTPTLRLVVDRDRERLRFKPVDHFLPRIVFRHANGTFTASWVVPAEYDGLDSEGRLVDKAVAERIVAKIAGKQGRVASFKAETKFKAPPLPYSLSALQTECGAKLGMTAQEVLDTAQSLYEKHKATTYPRSDSRYLPTSILKDEAPAIMEALAETPGIDVAAGSADLSLRSAAWNDGKVSDHHGIIPTTDFNAATLERMSETERKVFFIIARAFVSQFHPPFKYKALSAEISCERETFKANGRQVIDNGWKKVYGAEDADDEDDREEDADQTLPAMSQGDPVEAEKGDIASRRTTPPPGFTDGTLIAAMANVHRFVTNPEVKKRLKESDGLGTEATRAPTIEKLLKKRFLVRKGKNGLESTELGRSIIDALPEDLKDPGLTALWEGALDQVAKGSLDPERFMAQMAKSIADRVEASKGTTINLKGARTIRPIEGHGEECPKCGKGTLVTREVGKGDHKGKKYLSCTNYPECKHSQWPQPKVDPLPGHGKACPQCGKGKLLTREVKTKDGRKARLLSCDNYPDCKHGEWPQVPPIEGHGKACPKCGTGKMLTRQVNKEGPHKGQRFLGCDNAECRNAEFPQPKVDPLPGHGKGCPKCGKGRLLTKQITGKTGKTYVLLSCDNYPDCKHGEWPEAKVDPIEGHGKTCPQCGKGQLLTKEITAKSGKKYKLLSCNSYPECKHSEFPDSGEGRGRVTMDVPPLPGHGKACPQCGKGKLLTKQITGKDGRTHKLLSCDNYPACKHGEWPDRAESGPRAAGGGRRGQ